MTLRVDSSASGMRVKICSVMFIALLVVPFEAVGDTLTLGKEGPKTAYEGDLIEYSLGVLNTGVSPVEGIEVLDALPVEVDFVDATSTPDAVYDPVSGTWTLPTLGSGEQENAAELAIQALVRPNLIVDPAMFVSVTNQATIISPILPEPITAEAITNIVCAFCIDWEILSVEPGFEDKVEDNEYKSKYLFYVKVANNGPATSEATVRATHFSLSGGGFGNVELSPSEPVAVSLAVGEVKTLTYSTDWNNGPDSDYEMSWEFEINDVSLVDPILPNTVSGSFKGDVKGGSGGGGGCTINEQEAIDTVWLFFLILTCIWYFGRNYNQ